MFIAISAAKLRKRIETTTKKLNFMLLAGQNTIFAERKHTVMKKRYTFSTGESFEADLEDLQRLLEQNRLYLDNYSDVYSSLEDDDYVARGNGFCDRKYSDDFIEGQMEKYAQRVKDLESWIAEWV